MPNGGLGPNPFLRKKPPEEKPPRVAVAERPKEDWRLYEAAKRLKEKEPTLPPIPSEGIEYTVEDKEGKPLELHILEDFEYVGTERKIRSQDYVVFHEGKEIGRYLPTGEFISKEPTWWEKTLGVGAKTLEYAFYPFTIVGQMTRDWWERLKATAPWLSAEEREANLRELEEDIARKAKEEGLKQILPGGSKYEEFRALPWYQQIAFELPAWIALSATGLSAIRGRAALAPVPGVAPKVARAALVPAAVYEKAVATGLKYGIGIPLKATLAGSRKAFEKALDLGLDKWLVRQGIRGDQANRIVRFFLEKNNRWLYRQAETSIKDKLAKKIAATQAGRVAANDVVKAAEPMLRDAVKSVTDKELVPAVVVPKAPIVPSVKPPTVPEVKSLAVEGLVPRVREDVAVELDAVTAEIEGLNSYLATEPARKLISIIKRAGKRKGKIANLTIRQYKELIGKETVSPTMLTPDKKHVVWEYALDDTATELGYRSGEELRYAIEQAGEAYTRLAELSSQRASLAAELASVEAIPAPEVQPTIAALEARRLEIQGLLAEPAKELPKGITKIALRKELSGISKQLIPTEKKLRQTIMAAVKTKALPASQYRKIFREQGGSRQLSNVTYTGLNKVLQAVRVARPVKIKGKIVLKPQTERNIQSLKDILIAEQKLTPEIYEGIKRYLKLPTDKFEGSTRFITESEARNLIREMNYEAESGLAEWDARVANALANKPEIKAALDKLSTTIEQENLATLKKRTRINWRKFALEISELPNDVGLSGTMSVLRALRRFQEQLGGRSATRIYNVAEMMVETKRLNDLRLTQRLNEMKREVPSLTRVVQNKESMERIQQWLDADLAVPKVAKPTGITDVELEVAELFRREYDEWKDVVRLERFKDAYYHYKGNADLIKSGTERTGDVAMPDAPLADIKEAIRIYEGQGESALSDFLKTKTWGVLKSGYSFSQVIHPRLRIGQRISIRATTTSLHQRKGLEFRKDERMAWQRLIAYERQMIGLNLQPYFRKMDREFRRIVELERLADPRADANKISLFLREVKGFPVESPVIRVMLRIGGWSFGTLSKVPWMSIRNLHQNIAFHPDKAEVARALTTGGFFGDPAARNGRLDYTNALVHQFRGVVQEQLLMGYIGKTPLENLIRASDYYHLSDKLNRFASMAGSGAKADRALRAFVKDGNVEKFLKNSGANELSLTEQTRILEYLSLPDYDYGGVLDTVSGGEAAIREIGKAITTLTHFNYIRYLRSIYEMGEVGRLYGSLVAFPRSIVERYADFFSRLRPARKLSGAGRRRAFHSLLAMIIGSAIASAMLSTITGKKRDAYNPLLVLQWQVGGLAIGATEELTELYRHLSNLAFAKEESEKDYALKELAIIIPRLGEMFIPFYAPTMNVIEALYNERYIDRKMYRQLRAMFDKDYEPNLEFYEKERTTLEKWQHALFGTRTPDPSDLEQALLDIKGLRDKLGKIDEDAIERDKQKAFKAGEAFKYLPSDYIYTTGNLGSDFNRAIYGLDPTVITLESGFSPLLLDYLEYQQMFDEYKDAPTDKRYEFREKNPITDANLFFWGYVTTLQSDAARILVIQMMRKYNIPPEAIRRYENEFGGKPAKPGGRKPSPPATRPAERAGGGLGPNPFE